jgi:hypothetical protein
MRYTRAVAFAGLRQALEFHDLLIGDDPWCEAIRQRLAVLQGRPLTRSELWTINKLIEAVIGRVLGLNPQQNMAANKEDACRKIEANNRSKGRLSA